MQSRIFDMYGNKKYHIIKNSVCVNDKKEVNKTRHPFLFPAEKSSKRVYCASE